MQTLHEYNAKKYEEYGKMYQTTGTGIACPECQHELEDENPFAVLTSIPPKRAVMCAGCGYRGHRLV